MELADKYLEHLNEKLSGPEGAKEIEAALAAQFWSRYVFCYRQVICILR